jgi:uncharacterized delta-60 repeat protein
MGVLMDTGHSTNRKFKGIPAHILRICALLAIALANTSFPARAAQNASAFLMPLASAGSLDTSFSGDGKLITTFVTGQGAIARGVAIQSNGRIVVMGETVKSDANRNIALARYTATGALDTTFNGTGKKVVSVGANDQGLGLAIQPANRKIVVVGQKCTSDWSLCDAVVLRFNPNGSLDRTFNGTGIRSDDLGGDNGSLAVAVQPDGKIVAVGYMFSAISGSYDFAILRYTAAGALDKTFSGDGKQSISFSVDRLDEGRQVAIQSDGKIVIAGKSCDSNYANCHFALARLNVNGSLDTTFNTTGKQITSFGASETPRGMVLQTDGKIVLAGFKDTGATSYFALARYNTNGRLDKTFAGTGKKVTNFSGDANADSAAALRIQPDGKIVVCGDVSNGASNDIALARYTSNGALDTTFSGDGKSTVDFGQDDHCWALGLQGDGKYVPVGYSDNGVLTKWVAARVLP